ncbi:hypothetical protein MG293_020518 [Ovis ammon polii]|uniref:Uncharacterized protein n=1 Tax=Ovis ammon polii TaxID=230172 RepID=A0AAD4XX54_OVIAM|nr:hypothetical protein MG293_020518 [Ovis ammon polii]KAI4550140.1 hypothetical protein MJT46_018866 [Ovis ammon polii x Ovis aries]
MEERVHSNTPPSCISPATSSLSVLGGKSQDPLQVPRSFINVTPKHLKTWSPPLSARAPSPPPPAPDLLRSPSGSVKSSQTIPVADLKKRVGFRDQIHISNHPECKSDDVHFFSYLEHPTWKEKGYSDVVSLEFGDHYQTYFI